MTAPHSQGGPPPDTDDISLVQFLRANAAPVSPPPSNLEEQVMGAITQHSLTTAVPSRRRRHWRNTAIIGAGVAIIGVGLLQIQHWLMPSEFSTAQLEELDSYMTGSLDFSNSTEPLAEFDWGSQAQIGGYSQQTQTLLNLED